MDLIGLIDKYKNWVVNILICIVAFFIIKAIYTNQTENIARLNKAKEEESRKNEKLADISQLEKKINAFKKTINNKQISSVINTLGNLAKESSVRITSIKPAREQDYPLYIKYPFDLTIEADNYHLIGKFMSRLEKHPDVYIVETATLRPETQTQQEGGSSKLIADLKISTILLKD